jgi:hypothetical protein
VFTMSAKAGKGAPLGLPSRLPDATRTPETAGSLANPSADVRFGTEGSEVRILSPRPKTSRKRLGSCCGVSIAEVPSRSELSTKSPPQRWAFLLPTGRSTGGRRILAPRLPSSLRRTGPTPSPRGNTSVQLVEAGTIKWSYSVNKGRGEKNMQSMAEAIAKHLKSEFFKK